MWAGDHVGMFTSICPFSVVVWHRGNLKGRMATAGLGSVGGYLEPLHGMHLKNTSDLDLLHCTSIVCRHGFFFFFTPRCALYCSKCRSEYTFANQQKILIRFITIRSYSNRKQGCYPDKSSKSLSKWLWSNNTIQLISIVWLIMTIIGPTFSQLSA